MTKNELIDKLLHINGNPLVILATDSEGNSFTDLVDVGLAAYDKDSNRIGLFELTDEWKEFGFTDEDVLSDGEPVIVLWP